MRTYFGNSTGDDVHVLIVVLSFMYNWWSTPINKAKMTSKDGTAHTEIRQHNTIGVVMEDLPEAERSTLKKELQEEMAAARRRKLTCFQKNMHWGDQEDRPNCHDYHNYGYDIHGNS
jgi:hypothetical protein